MSIIIRDIFIAHRSKNIMFDARQPPSIVGHTEQVVGYLALPVATTMATHVVGDKTRAGCQGEKTPKQAVDGPRRGLFFTRASNSAKPS